MVIRSAKQQYGFTLFEVTIATFLSSLMMGMLLMLLHLHLNSAQGMLRHLSLAQQLQSAMTVMQRQVRLAGGSGGGAGSILSLANDTHIIARHETSAFGFVYQTPEGLDDFEHIGYVWRDKQLLICEKVAEHILSLAQLLISTHNSPCYSVFDSETIHVQRFHVTTPVSISAVDDNDGIVITLAVVDVHQPDEMASMTMQLSLRNGGGG